MYVPVPQKSRYFDNYSISDHFHPMQATGQSELRLATVRYPGTGQLVPKSIYLD